MQEDLPLCQLLLLQHEVGMDKTVKGTAVRGKHVKCKGSTVFAACYKLWSFAGRYVNPGDALPAGYPCESSETAAASAASVWPGVAVQADPD